MAAITETNETKAEETTQDSMPLFFGDAKEVVARYTHCALCGSNLHFNHITDFAKNMTQEIARCPECGGKARLGMLKLPLPKRGSPPFWNTDRFSDLTAPRCSVSIYLLTDLIDRALRVSRALDRFPT